MNPDARRPLEPDVAAFERDLDRFVKTFYPWSVGLEAGEPAVEFADPATELVTRAAQLLTGRMLRRVDVTNAKTWRAAARESLHGKKIYEALRAEMGGALGTRYDDLLLTNVQLLKRLPAQLEQRATSFIAREQRRGRRASAIENELRAKLPQVARSQVKMLARTAVGRAETAFTQARAERLGLAWYEWATSEDRRVRLSHRKMDKVLVAWNDPPSPEALIGETSKLGRYAPGTIYNCRCLALPLIDLNEVRWPHKVYSHGRIEYVHRAQFERWIKLPEAA